MDKRHVDTRGLLCPEPMLMVKREIEAMDSGVIEALADNSAARENIKRLALSKGWKVEIRSQEGDYLLTLSK
ncbi:MAG: sulfurtransferase TusA family protein [Bacillota bacterium]|uniref:sulfurtransferase TusA family protein n=1 Tax=Desulforudis sp. DRI-14 TaxID=3459793 RepID=UPI00346D7C72